MIAFTKQRSANRANEKDPKKERIYHVRRLNPPRPIFDTPTRFGVDYMEQGLVALVNRQNRIDRF
jgi:hypothetical protein